MGQSSQETPYRWYILSLAALTNALVVAAPAMAMPVLFKQISTDLNLNLVQVGMIWGIGSLPGILTALAGGAIGDRFGPRRVLILGCILVGVAGASRGLSSDFITLLATMFLLGLLTPAISMNTIKTCGMWFSRRQLGLANGALSMGMAMGFLIGSFFSATVFSPLMGGWRGVFFLYGAIAILLCLPWYFVRPAPALAQAAGGVGTNHSMRQNMATIIRIPNVWWLGLTILGIGGCIQGTLGYLPLYLRNMGWAAASADGALSAFHTISMIFVIPIAILSDRIGSRKKVLLASTFIISLGVGLLSVVNGPAVWFAVCLAGMVRDGFMGVFMTAIIESEGVGPAYAGTAVGAVMIFSGISNLVSPPLGNSLASISPGLPFLFWAGMTALAFIGILATKERRAEKVLPEV